MDKEQELNRLATLIRRNMAKLGETSISPDEAEMYAEMGSNPGRLRAVLESFADVEPKPEVLEIYKRFCGGVQ